MVLPIDVFWFSVPIKAGAFWSNNLEPSELGASFGLVQLDKFKNFTKLRNRNFEIHRTFFKKLNNFFIVPKISKNVKTNFLAYPIILKSNLNFSRKDLQIYLEKNNIQTRTIFTGNILKQPIVKNRKYKKLKNSEKNSNDVMKNGILIGCHQGMRIEEINYIFKTFNKFLNKLVKPV